jgi:hypothetical protein
MQSLRGGPLRRPKNFQPPGHTLEASLVGGLSVVARFHKSQLLVVLWRYRFSGDVVINLFGWLGLCWLSRRRRRSCLRLR